MKTRKILLLAILVSLLLAILLKDLFTIFRTLHTELTSILKFEGNQHRDVIKPVKKSVQKV